MSDDNSNFSTDSFTEVTSTGWVSRIGQSLAGVVFGFIGILVAIGVLYWNEGRAVEAHTALSEGAGAVVTVPAQPVNPAMEGRLVHVVGLAETQNPARDPILGVSAPGLLRLHRIAETYQWKETQRSQTNTELGGSEQTRTTYEYSKVWSESAISSSEFRIPNGHGNPALTLKSQHMTASTIRLGDFRVAPALLEELDAYEPLVPDEAVMGAKGFRPLDGMFFRGNDPGNPRVGDVRVRFEAVASQPVTVVAGQVAGELGSFIASNGYKIDLIATGNRAASAMFKMAQQDEAILTWVIRVCGFFGMMICIAMLFQPLVVLVSVLPFLEVLAGGGALLASFLLAVPLTLITIAIAWFAHRPLLSAILIVAGIGGSLLVSRLVKRKPA